MKHIAVLAAILLAACSTTPATKPATPKPSPAPTEAAAQPVADQSNQAPVDAAPPLGGLSDLESMTFACPRAGLNAAAREAARAQAQGRYRFSYFKVISDSHHSLYEVHFTSNDHDDPELKYCVSVYCQQGWDPKNAKIAVTPMTDAATPAKAGATGAAHGAHCGADPQTPVKQRRPKR